MGTLVYTTAALVTLFFWLLLGDFALTLRDRSVGPVSQLFLKREGASDTIIAFLLTSLPPLITVLIGPIVSYRSDRLRTRWGRRLPYLAISTPVATLAMVGIAFCPTLSGALQKLIGGALSPAHCTILVLGCSGPSSRSPPSCRYRRSMR